MPGDSLIITITLVNEAPLLVGSKFVMREGNLTIGAGVVTTILK
jgi:translation elongation factor EF-Tu-like GTPase